MVRYHSWRSDRSYEKRKSLSLLHLQDWSSLLRYRLAEGDGSLMAKHVLVVDDDPSIRQALQQTLGAELDIRTAESAELSHFPGRSLCGVGSGAGQRRCSS